jgi:hypothetical protein
MSSSSIAGDAPAVASVKRSYEARDNSYGKLYCFRILPDILAKMLRGWMVSGVDRNGVLVVVDGDVRVAPCRHEDSFRRSTTTSKKIHYEVSGQQVALVGRAGARRISGVEHFSFVSVTENRTALLRPG